ncbi:MAG: hypothetical protein E4H20_04790 [Spirochaetales bacterium]|nr:MAG: hypothetical protein E4H20_04790 [Spirochaetales bacterium]
MRNRLIPVLTLAFMTLAVPGANAFDVSSLALHLHLSGMKEASPPRIVDDYLVLSASGPYRFVGAAFSHEDWRSIHSFERNRYGVFVLAVPVPYGSALTIGYRLVLDGVWAADPVNPRRVRDEQTGASLSLAEFPERPRTVLGVWDPAGNGGATFFFQGESGQRVSVAGTFNAWDPFIHEMLETTPGYYKLSLDLPPGDYYYVFIYRGERVPDPLNRRLLYGSDGRAVSAITVTRL